MIQRTAEKELGTLSATRLESLYEFIPRITPTMLGKPTLPPRHLGPLVDALEQAKLASRGEADPVFVCSSVPPQHGKTATILHALAWWISEQPHDFLAYLSYGAEFAEQKSRECRDYAKLAGVKLREDSRSVKTWHTTEGGGLMARGLTGGSITGQSGISCLVIDDPYKNRAEAESRVTRDRVWDEFRSSVWSRLHVGTSVIINHTRWHVDDLIGRIKKDPELSKLFRTVNLPAINDQGQPLWPEIKPLHLLNRQRAGTSEYEWWSLYMGEPRPRDTQLFRDVSYYEALPTGLRVAIGVDLAYTSKTSSDWSVAVVMGAQGDRYFVLDVLRKQCSATDFASDLKALQARWPGASCRAYIGGTERGVVDFLQKEGVRMKAEPAVTDKFVRAQPLSAAWNAGQVYMPRDKTSREGSHFAKFLACLLDFTGQNDPHDDDVDAAAAAFDALKGAGGELVYRPQREDKPRRERGFSSRGNPWR